METVRRNAAQLVESDGGGITQRLQERSRPVFGPVVEQTVATITAAHLDERPDCPLCQQPMRLVDSQRTRDLQGLVGDDNLKRADFFWDHCRQGLAPLDKRLGRGSRALSPGLARVAGRREIEDLFKDTCYEKSR